VKLSNFATNSYLTGAEISGTRPIKTIESVYSQFFGNGDDANERIVLRFVGEHKQLKLNPTSVSTLINAYGDDPSALVGKKIGLHTENMRTPQGPWDVIYVDILDDAIPSGRQPELGDPAPF
jgi:hypothetical protein